MARSRNIKPGFFQNEDLADLSFQDRLFFIGLWTICDYKGCLELRPKRIKVALMPYDDCDIEESVLRLNKSGFVRIYSVDGRNYIKIANFQKHQHPHKNEIDSGSDVPDEPPQITDNIGVTEKPDLIGTEPDLIGTTPPSYLLPLTDSLNPQPPLLEIHLGKILNGVMKHLGLKTVRGMGPQKDWIEHGTIAFENGFTAEQFIECFILLGKQEWRNGAVKPAYVTEHLPVLAKLRKGGAAASGNGGPPQWQIDRDACEKCDERGYILVDEKHIVCKHK